jgi:hypothetical protein
MTLLVTCRNVSPQLHSTAICEELLQQTLGHTLNIQANSGYCTESKVYHKIQQVYLKSTFIFRALKFRNRLDLLNIQNYHSAC